MQPKFQNLQALRGIACLLVVLLHLWGMEKAFGGQTLSAVEWFGFAGVDLFFVISGFIITTTSRRHLGVPAQAPTFLFRRLWRIYPMFWVAMAISVPASMACFDPAPLLNLSGETWAKWLALLPSKPENLVIVQAWTLEYELMFYLVFAAVLCVPPRLGAGLLAGWAIIVGVEMVFGGGRKPFAGHFQSPYVLEFLAGSLIAWLSEKGVRAGGWLALAGGVASAAVGILVASRMAPEAVPAALAGEPLRVPIFGPASALIVYGFVSLEGRMRMPRSLLRIGDASYSLYLLHMAVLCFASVVGFKVAHSGVPHYLWLVGTLASCVIVGLAAHRLVEKPLLNLWQSRKAKSEGIK